MASNPFSLTSASSQQTDSLPKLPEISRTTPRMRNPKTSLTGIAGSGDFGGIPRMPLPTGTQLGGVRSAAPSSGGTQVGGQTAAPGTVADMNAALQQQALLANNVIAPPGGGNQNNAAILAGIMQAQQAARQGQMGGTGLYGDFPIPGAGIGRPIVPGMGTPSMGGVRVGAPSVDFTPFFSAFQSGGYSPEVVALAKQLEAALAAGAAGGGGMTASRGASLWPERA